MNNFSLGFRHAPNPKPSAPEYSLDQALRVQQKKMTFSAYSMR